jgi:hypothetical protein
MAARGGEHVAQRPAPDDGVGDHASGLQIEAVQVVQERSADGFVRLLEQPLSRPAAGEDHEAAAAAARRAVPEYVRLVGEQVE